jgi:hypothetical protein
MNRQLMYTMMKAAAPSSPITDSAVNRSNLGLASLHDLNYFA